MFPSPVRELFCFHGCFYQQIAQPAGANKLLRVGAYRAVQASNAATQVLLNCHKKPPIRPM